MNIPALIVEKNLRVGDNWRQRYPTLTLHSVKTQHTSMFHIYRFFDIFTKYDAVLYQPFHHNWPIYTPRDKLAHWLEQYAETDDLVVWTNSRPLPTPKYDPARQRWTVVIDREGKRVTIHPVHIIVAAGTLGAPLFPFIRDPERFTGIKLHAGYYHGGAPFAEKRVIVIGAGNSAADICQDLSFQGARSVTMVQRSSTCVMSAANARVQTEQLWPADVPTEVADFKLNATPLLLVKRILRAHEAESWEAERETHRGLREAGLKLNMGDGSGAYPLMFERFGGAFIFSYFIGYVLTIQFNFAGYCNHKASLTASFFANLNLDRAGCWLREANQRRKGQGEAGCRSCPIHRGFAGLHRRLVFTGRRGYICVRIVYAHRCLLLIQRRTSYENIRDNMRALFSDSVIDQTSPVWGVDDEGEIRGCYRASGHPGVRNLRLKCLSPDI